MRWMVGQVWGKKGLANLLEKSFTLLKSSQKFWMKTLQNFKYSLLICAKIDHYIEPGCRLQHFCNSASTPESAWKFVSLWITDLWTTPYLLSKNLNEYKPKKLSWMQSQQRVVFWSNSGVDWLKFFVLLKFMNI